MYIFQKRNYRSKIYFISKYILFYEICIWSNISLFIGIKSQKNEIKLFPFPFPFVFVCVRVFVCSSAVHGKYGAFHNLAKAHAQIIICLQQSDSHTQLINTRTLGHTHKWFLHACRHTHTQTPTQTHSYTCVSQNCSPAGVDSSICREREK